MAGINKVIIVGNLGGDPELKEIGAGKYVCNFSVATSEEWLDKTTNQKKLIFFFI
jgi:single-strand DNA-binding protein